MPHIWRPYLLDSIPLLCKTCLSMHSDTLRDGLFLGWQHPIETGRATVQALKRLWRLVSAKQTWGLRVNRGLGELSSRSGLFWLLWINRKARMLQTSILGNNRHWRVYTTQEFPPHSEPSLAPCSFPQQCLTQTINLQLLCLCTPQGLQEETTQPFLKVCWEPLCANRRGV